MSLCLFDNCCTEWAYSQAAWPEIYFFFILFLSYVTMQGTLKWFATSVHINVEVKITAFKIGKTDGR